MERKETKYRTKQGGINNNNHNTTTNNNNNNSNNNNKRLIGASLKRAPQLRVDLAFCHDIYI